MVIINNVNGSTFSLNGTRYIKNFMIIKQGSTNVAIHNAYDTKYQLLSSTHYSQISVNNQVYTNQTDLMAALAPVLFANSFIGGNVTSTSQLLNDGSDGVNPFVTTADLPSANKIVNQTGYNLSGETLTINPDWVWLISNQQYYNAAEVELTIPLAASGMTRIDLIVSTTGSTFERITGVEAEDNAIAPPLPNNTIQATLIVVTDGIEPIVVEPTPTGDLYLQKADEKIAVISSTGTISNFGLKNYTNYYINETSSITNINGASFLANVDSYSGKRVRFINKQSTPITFIHNGGTGTLKFDLINGLDYELKSNENISFIVKDGDKLLQVSNKFTDDNFVHLTGDEIIDGSKKINQDLILNQKLKFLFDEDKFIDVYADGDIFKGIVNEKPLFEIQKGSLEFFNTSDVKARIQSFNLTGATRTFELPDNDGTIALLSDIPTGSTIPTLEQVTSAGNNVTDKNINFFSNIDFNNSSGMNHKSIYFNDSSGIYSNLIALTPNGLSYLSNHFGATTNVGFSAASQNNNIYFPNASGTVALKSDIPSLTGYVTTTTNQSIGGVKDFSNAIIKSNTASIGTSGGGFFLGNQGNPYDRFDFVSRDDNDADNFGVVSISANPEEGINIFNTSIDSTKQSSIFMNSENISMTSVAGGNISKITPDGSNACVYIVGTTSKVAKLKTGLITGTKEFDFPNTSGTIALTSQIHPATKEIRMQNSTWNPTALNTWKSWGRTSSSMLVNDATLNLGTSPTLTLASFADCNYLLIDDVTKLNKISFSVREPNALNGQTMQLYIHSFNLVNGTGRGLETNLQVLVNETFTFPASSSQQPVKNNWTIANHTLSGNIGIQIAFRITTGAAFNPMQGVNLIMEFLK